MTTRNRNWSRLGMLLAALAMIAGAVWLVAWSKQRQGMEVTVEFRATHGLKSGDEVRLESDNVVGVVAAVEPLEDLSGSLARLRLTGRRAVQERIAREGTRWYIVRSAFGGPELVRGVETIVGAKYVVAIPGTGAVARRFTGLEEMPIVRQRHPRDLRVRLVSPRAHAVGPGAPVTYRGMRIGTVLSKDLSPDGNRVVTEALIDHRHAGLLDRSSRFFVQRGLQVHVGLEGLSFQTGSLEELLSGSVGLATPSSRERRGPPVEGDEFELSAEPKDEWLAWEPSIDVGGTAPADVAPVHATIAWETARLKRNMTRSGLVLPTSRGLLGPAELFRPDPKWTRSFTLEVAGTFVPNSAPILWSNEDLALVDFVLPGTTPPTRIRAPGEPEPCVVHGAVGTARLEVAALQASGPRWEIADPSQFGPAWHGAAVTAVSDGRVIGILLCPDGKARIAILPAAATLGG